MCKLTLFTLATSQLKDANESQHIANLVAGCGTLGPPSATHVGQEASAAALRLGLDAFTPQARHTCSSVLTPDP